MKSLAKRLLSLFMAILLLVPFFGSTALAYGGKADPTHQSRYSGFAKSYGVDVSHFQNDRADINWSAAKGAGTSFAIIKMGGRSISASGSLYMDAWYGHNMEGAAAAGVSCGIYFFSQALSVAEAVEEANYVLANKGGYGLELPIMMDYEYNARMTRGSYGPDVRTQIIKAFLDTIRSAGYSAGLYCNKSTLTNDLYADQIASSYPVWLAHYTDNTDYAGEFRYWQYADNGNVSGIQGAVDLDVWYVDRPFKVKYVLNDNDMSRAKNDPKNKTSYWASDSGFELRDPTRPGYRFVNWYQDEALTVPAPGTVYGSDCKDYTFYAKWEPIKYDLTYVIPEAFNGATFPDEKIESFTIESDFNLPRAAYPGYTFAGWYRSFDDKKLDNGMDGYSDRIDAILPGDARSLTKNFTVTGASLYARFTDPGLGYEIVDVTPSLGTDMVRLNSKRATDRSEIVINPVAATSIISASISDPRFSFTDFAKQFGDGHSTVYSAKLGTNEVLEDGVYSMYINAVVVKNTAEEAIEPIDCQIPIRVKVSNSLPDFTITQCGEFNRFYTDETVAVSLTSRYAFDTSMPVLSGATANFAAKSYSVTGAGIQASLVIGYASADGSLGDVDPEKGVNTNLSITASFKDYREPVTKEFALKTYHEAPMLMQNISYTKLFSPDKLGNRGLEITNTNTGEVLTSLNTSFELINSSPASISYLDQKPVIDPVITNGFFGNDYIWDDFTLGVKQANWRSYVPVSHRFIYTDTLRISAQKAQFYINSAVNTVDVMELKSDVTGIDWNKVVITDSQIADVNSKGKIKLSYAEGKLTAALTGKVNPGIYKFTVTPRYQGIEKALSSFSVSVYVVNSEIKATVNGSASTTATIYKASATTKRSTYDKYDTVSIKVSVSDSRYKIASIDDVELVKNYNGQDYFEFTKTLNSDGTVTVVAAVKTQEDTKNYPTNNKGYGFKVKVQPTCIETGSNKNAEGKLFSAKEATLTLKAFNSNGAVNVSKMGKINLLNRSKGVDFTVNSFSNTNLGLENIVDISLADEKTDKQFDLLCDLSACKANGLLKWTITADREYQSTLAENATYYPAVKITFDNGSLLITGGLGVTTVLDSANITCESDTNIYVDAYHREFRYTLKSDVCPIEKVTVDTRATSAYLKDKTVAYVVDNHDGTFDLSVSIIYAKDMRGDYFGNYSVLVTPKGSPVGEDGKKVTQRYTFNIGTKQNEANKK